jgi:hypothetical protein
VLYTLPFWREAIENPRFIGTFRHPLSVASSIHARNSKFSIEYGLEVWKEYNLLLMDYYEKDKFPLVSFDADSIQYLQSVERCLKHIGVSHADVSKMDFFDDSLRHNKNIGFSVELPPEVAELYEKLVSSYNLQKT